jgi:hypothetical protein
MSKRFFDESSGATLHMDRYYGFADGGGLAGSFDGYDSYLGAAIAIKAEYGDDDTSTDPKDLGDVAICIITGQQYIDRLKKVGGEANIGVFGYFVD